MFVISLLACNGAPDGSGCPSGTVWNADAQQCFDKDTDGDGWADLYDCDDDDPEVHPGAPEICDGIDNDCNGLTDDEDGNVAGDTTFYADLDQDGHAGDALTVRACEKPEGFMAVATDCDDVDGRTYPDAPELCDGLDNDCDGAVDEGDDTCSSGGGGDFFGDITITSPEGAASFCENYGGTLYGTLTLSGYGLTDLSAIDCVEAIYGSLVIDLPLATAVEMPNLVLVDGDIVIELYEDTQTVGFESLTESGVIELYGGESLDTVNLPALSSALGLSLGYLPSLETLSLPALTELGLFYSWDNFALSTLELPLLDSVQDVEIFYNDGLASLDLSSATSIGDIRLYGNPDLTSVDLTGATALGEVTVEYNNALQSLDLDTATELGGLVLRSNQVLQTVTWGGIDQVGGDVIFYDNDSLTLPDHSNITQVDGDWGLWYSNTNSLDDLASLEVLLGDLYLVDNGLQSVDLSSLTQLGGLYLYNEDLSSLDLSDLEEPLSGNFYVAYNYDLYDFGWPEFGDLEGSFVWLYNGPMDTIEADSLTSVGGELRINDGNWGAIEDVELSNLESVGGQVQIEYIDGVDTLDLGALEEVGSSFRVYYSDYIDTVDLGSLTSVGGDFYLYETGFYADDFDLDIAALEEVDGTVYLSYLAYYGDGSDIDLEFDSLERVGGGFYIQYVNGYYGGDVNIGAGALTSLGSSLYIRYNGRSYNQSDNPGDVEADFSALETVGGSISFYYNGYGSSIYSGNSGDTLLDLTSLRSANGSLEFGYNGYCHSGHSSYRCSAGNAELRAPDLESIGNSSVYIRYNGYADYGNGGDVVVELSSLTSISGELSIEYNGYAYFSQCYNYVNAGDVEFTFTDLETIGNSFYLYYTGYAYNGCHGHNSYADHGDVDTDFSSLREMYSLNVYRTGIQNFSDWGSLEEITNSMSIRYNYRLTNVQGLQGGDFVDYMEFYGNYSLGNSPAWDVYYSWTTVNGYYITSN